METLFSADNSIWTCGELNSPNSTEEMFNYASNMAGFALSPLELEPLTSIFASTNNSYKDKNDLLLSSFKSSLNPGGMSPMPYPNNYSQSQQLLSPNGYSSNYCLDQPFVSNPSNVPTATGTNFGTPFPSMSVNVSMNMTMGYLPPPDPGLQHQMSWPCPAPTGSSHAQPMSNNYTSSYSASPTHQNFCHQPYSATYSFAADFRPESSMESLRSGWIPNSAPTLITSATALSCGSKSLGSTSSSKRQKSSRSSENFSPSLSSFGSKSNLCRICGKTYARPSTLKTHLRTHSGEKPYRCLECHKSFSQAANLTAHVRTHSGEKPFRCPICDRRFSQSSSVTTHMRTHSGERPYRCHDRLCKKAFSDSSTLTKHLRIHSGEKPYQCKLCLLRFSQSGNLNRHMRVHSSNA